MQATSSFTVKPMQLLVVNDFLPDPATDSGRRLINVLQALRELNHTATLVARDGKNREALTPAPQALGIRVYAGDPERLPPLGKDVNDFSWSLPAVLAEKQFDAAILLQNFRCGITVPEHYLDAIRGNSAGTRILVWNDALHGKSAHRRAAVTTRLEHWEVAEDWSAREREAFQRADLTVVSHAGDEGWVREHNPGIETAVVQRSFTGRRDQGWEQRNGILLTVDLTQPGDVDGFAWFLEKIWPALCQESTDISLLVAGAEALPQETREKLPRVKWLRASDSQHAAPRIFVTPLRFGRIPDNCARMIAQGTPGVVTEYAADSAGLKTECGILAAKTPAEFAGSVLELYRSPQRWDDVSAQGLLFAKEQFSWDGLKSGLQDALGRAQTLPGKAAAATSFSMTRVDSLYGETLNKAPREKRGALRLDGHVQLAQELLRTGKPAEARQQLRHVFSWFGETLQYSAPLARLLGLLARAYRELGDFEAVTRCAHQARQCFSAKTSWKPLPHSRPIPSRSLRPQISLIVPTYNRLPILKKCLSALESQTFPAKDFEVIVIDDGSSDGTEAMMRQYRAPFQLQYLRQANGGTGAARRNGVNHAQGEYLLLMNDDTICDPNLIAQHVRVQRELASERWAVLGNFEYPAEAHRRAFTHFLRTGSFMFPQIEMEDGFPYPYSHFITCNLSVRRDAVIEAGSFDSTYKLSEDTELGIRLFEMGYGVLYHPGAHAWHDHLPYAVSNLIRRARVYGADYFYMFRRHPRVVQEWAMPINLAGMDRNAAQEIARYLEANRHNVEKAAAALDQWENVEFEPFLKRPQDAAQVMALFQQAVPAIHWFYLLEKMLETMVQELNLSGSAMPEPLRVTAANVG